MDNIIMVEQGSPEWFEQRLGRLTASNFGTLMTLPRSRKDRELGLISQSTRSYLIGKVSEVLTGTSKNITSTKALEWGSATEDEARSIYELDRMVEVKQVGFAVLNTNPIIGGSPDGLVGEDGMIEIKCPDSDTFTGYLLGDSIVKNYMAQIQGNLWILNRKWCDFIVYDPRVVREDLRLKIIRVERDEEYINKVRLAVENALKHYRAMLGQLGLSFEDIKNVKYQA
ncbi:MAG: YqaJ viral recombinase family protein [Firmicutes bacterium]|nr:YqaJ viral recombinase family protein [Bacillota bacterium]